MVAFSHLDVQGKNPTMVDVSNKVLSVRKATAQARIFLPSNVYLELQKTDGNTKKGPVFTTAIIAGTMAAKNTSQMIPLCHPIGIENCSIELSFKELCWIQIECTVSVTAKTGVEMEALVGVSAAALTVYDMCKAMSHEIRIEKIELISKSGGKNDYQKIDN